MQNRHVCKTEHRAAHTGACIKSESRPPYGLATEESCFFFLCVCAGIEAEILGSMELSRSEFLKSPLLKIQSCQRLSPSSLELVRIQPCISILFSFYHPGPVNCIFFRSSSHLTALGAANRRNKLGLSAHRHKRLMQVRVLEKPMEYMQASSHLFKTG